MNELTTTEPPPEPWVNVPASVTSEGAPLKQVGLAAVVSWLMKAKGLDFPAALGAMCEALAGHVGLMLYLPNHLGRFCAVGAFDAFGLDAPPRWRRVFSPGIGMPPAAAVQPQPLPDGVTPGVSAALYRALHEPNKPGALISFLAMPCEQAAQLWGRGSEAVAVSLFPLDSWGALVTYRKANTKNGRGPDWGAGNQREIAKEELARKIKASGATESAALDAMGRELGYTCKEPRKPLKKALTSERKREHQGIEPQLVADSPNSTKVRDGRKVA